MSDDPELPSPTNAPADVTPTARFCTFCQRHVEPVGRGKCPTCAKWTVKNNAARKHPVNVSRRETILAELLADFPPANILERADREDLAAAQERLETTRPGSPEWGRLMASVKSLRDALRETAATLRVGQSWPGLDRVPASALRRAHALVARQLAGERLSERELGRLEELEAAMRGEVLLPPDPISAPLPAAEPADVALQARDAQPATRAAAPVDESDTTPSCHYCGGGPCVGPDDVLYPTLHFCDPKEVQRRDKEATAIMLRQIGKPSPW